MEVLHATSLLCQYFNTPFFHPELFNDRDAAELFYNQGKEGVFYLRTSIRLAKEYLSLLEELKLKLPFLEKSCSFWKETIADWEMRQSYFETQCLEEVCESESKEDICNFWEAVNVFQKRIDQLVARQYHYEHILFRELMYNMKNIEDKYFTWVKDIPPCYPENMMSELRKFTPFELGRIIFNMFKLTRAQIERVLHVEIDYKNLNSEDQSMAFKKRRIEFEEMSVKSQKQS